MISDKITLNVRGTPMMIGKDTLEKLDKLKNELEKWPKNKELFVDCDPKIFRHVQNVVSMENYEIPIKCVHNVQVALDFYSYPKKFTVNAIPKESVLTTSTFNYLNTMVL